jgi:hypothetical protein
MFQFCSGRSQANSRAGLAPLKAAAPGAGQRIAVEKKAVHFH